MKPESSFGLSRCPLCSAVVDAAQEAEPFVYNTRLLETPNFVVTPCIGPLVQGHVLVVSRTHSESLASMGEDAIREYNALAAQLRKASLLWDGDPLEAEHGSTPNDKAGACVVHTHVHWLPGMGRFVSDFLQRLKIRHETDLSDVGQRREPYIFVRNGHRQAIFEARGLPSQMIRRILCAALDRDDTDWTQSPRLDWVEATVEAWRRHDASL